MESTALILMICAIVAAGLGIIGSVVPAIPGPPIGWVGVLLMYLRSIWYCPDSKISLGLTIATAIVMVAVTIVDFIVPSILTKKTGGSKAAAWGSMIGIFVGLFVLPPIGILVGPFLGAFIGELCFAGKSEKDSLKAALGAFLGFILGSGLKLICTLSFLVLVIRAI